MAFTIVRNDITKMAVDAIVNTANPKPVVGAGVDSMIHEAAGGELLAARQVIGDIAVGDAAITGGYRLPARYVIHTVGPVWRGGLLGEGKLLRKCYDASLRLAVEHGCRSVAFPLIASGNYGFPKDKAMQIAIAAFSEFLSAHELEIYLVVFDKQAFRLSGKLFAGVASYIDQHYVDECEDAAYAVERCQRRSMGCTRAMPAKAALSLEDMLKQADAGFTETLLRRIDEKGLKDSQVYKKAGISKQHFSKIRNNPDYKPTKPTAVTLALALELDLKQTRDLIGRAGYALNSNSKFDLIIRYYIERKNYNVVEINMALYEFDQVLLGGKE